MRHAGSGSTQINCSEITINNNSDDYELAWDFDWRVRVPVQPCVMAWHMMNNLRVSYAYSEE